MRRLRLFSVLSILPLALLIGGCGSGSSGSSGTGGGLTAQTITFADPGTQTVGTPLALSATASSGLTVTFASATSSVCTVSGTTATFVAAGTCTVDANQAGDSTYAAASMVADSFTVDAAGSQTTTVYLAGYSDNPDGETVTAGEWQLASGSSTVAPTPLTSVGLEYPYSIAVSGGDVYVAGDASNGNAEVWQLASGSSTVTATPLTNGSTQNPEAYGIAVFGGNVYVAGWVIDSSNHYSIAEVWQLASGSSTVTATPLTNGSTQDAEATAIAVSGGDVYVAGNVYDSSTGNDIAEVWQLASGSSTVTATPLPGGNAYATGIAVSGGNVYAAGYLVDNSTGIATAEVWQFASGSSTVTATPLASGETDYPSGIAVSGGDVYVAGSENNIPVVWQLASGSSTVTATPLTGSTEYGYATGIAVSGGEVYVAGRVAVSSTSNYIAEEWQFASGSSTVAATPLTTGAANAGVNGIAVSTQ